MRSMNPPTICLGRFYFHSFDLRSPKRGKRAKFSTQESQVGKSGGVCVGEKIRLAFLSVSGLSKSTGAGNLIKTKEASLSCLWSPI